jgi:transcriptional regulator with XRE-family HTH domain
MELLKIKELLKEKGMTSKDLAEKLDVTPATVSNINNGNHFPKPDLLLKIAEVLDVDIKELFLSTKDSTGKGKEPIYIEKGGKYINIGEIRLNGINEG